jgi:hypothetical protein
VLGISVETWVLVDIEANWLATGTQVKQDDAQPRHMFCMGVLTRCPATAAQAYLDRRDDRDPIDWSLTDETADWGRRRAEQAEAALDCERDALLHLDARLTQVEVDAIAGRAKAIIMEGVLEERNGVRDSGLPQGLLAYLALLVPT